jgi:hypothetical protein
MSRIVCAANRVVLDWDDVVVICGARHYDNIMHRQVHRMPSISHKDWIEAEEGFIDKRGEFLTREEAWKVASREGQIIRRVGGDSINGGTLYSENLY